jgi:hypothetical protein
MMIQAGFLQVHRPGNIFHRGAMKSFLTKDLRSGFQDIVSGHKLSLPNGW